MVRTMVVTPALRQAQEGAPGHSGEQVGHEVGAAALPVGSSEHRGDGVLQPLVSIGGYQFHPAETQGGQRPQEGQPEEDGPENSPPLLPNESAEPGEPPSPGLEFTLADLRAGPEERVCLDRGSAVWEARIL